MARTTMPLALLVTVSLGATAAAQTPDEHRHGSVGPNASTVHQPSSFSGIGVLHFPITTRSAEAQRWFNRGVLFWHAYWDFEAARGVARDQCLEAFRDADAMVKQRFIPGRRE